MERGTPAWALGQALAGTLAALVIVGWLAALFVVPFLLWFGLSVVAILLAMLASR